MKQSVKIAALLLISLLLIACSGEQVYITRSAQRILPQATTNLLINGDFEDGFREWQAIGELKIAEGWAPWFVENQTAPSGQWHRRPEYKPEQIGIGSGRVYQGQFSTKQFTTFSPHNGGIYQRIPAEKDAWYTCKGYVYIWSSNENDPDHSIKPGRYRAMLGINGWGDTGGTSDTTVWGKEIVDDYDRWIELSVTAQAWSDHITIFTRGNPWFGVKHNDSYWDAMQCEKVSVTAQPTYTPYPTPEPCATSQPRDCDCPSLDEIRQAVREEIDNTRLTH